jgi:chitodextrinase
MSKINTHFQRTLASALIVAGTLITAPAAYATSKGLADWRATYPNSDSDTAGCQLCHSASTSQLNAYGKDQCVLFNGTVPSDWGDSLLLLGSVDSDLDPNASDNTLEIANDTQPGWTTALNPLYSAETCLEVAFDSTVPSGVPLPYDLVITGDPTANPAGPYQALVGEEVTFDGSGSTDDGTIVSWDWDFGDGSFGIGEMTTHTYFVADSYTVTLTVTDNDSNVNSAQTTATISDPELLDLDIDKFSVTKNTRVGKDVTIKLTVENNGTVLGQAIATVVGMQGGDEIYNRRLNVFDDTGKGTTTFKFQSYTAEASGEINWSVTIADGDPDTDEATAVTTVK